MSTSPSTASNTCPLPRFKRQSAGFIVTSFSIATVVTAGLFWIMYQLVSVIQPQPTERSTLTNVGFIDDVFDEPLPPPKRTKVVKPKVVDMPLPTSIGSWKGGISLPSFKFKNPDNLRILGPHVNEGIGIGERNYMPLHEFQPQYPERALYRGIEGICVVIYTITKTGSVSDVRVDPSRCSNTLFHSSSVKAASKFKYAPRIVDGQTVEARNVAKLFRFSIEN